MVDTAQMELHEKIRRIALIVPLVISVPLLISGVYWAMPVLLNIGSPEALPPMAAFIQIFIMFLAACACFLIVRAFIWAFYCIVPYVLKYSRSLQLIVTAIALSVFIFCLLFCLQSYDPLAAIPVAIIGLALVVFAWVILQSVKAMDKQKKSEA